MSNQANYIHVYPEERRQKLVKELTDYLFNKGYQISKPMIEDLALFVSDKIDEYGIKGSMHLTTSNNSDDLRTYIDARGIVINEPKSSNPSPSEGLKNL